MIDRTRQFRVGLIVVGAAILFVGLVVFILGSSFRTERINYFILFKENVKGMVIGSKVNFMGVPVGAVSDIRFHDGATFVELSVDPTKAKIQDVTRARLDRLLVTGQVTVELEGYDRTANRLPADSYIETKENPITELTADLPDVMSRLVNLLGGVDRVVSRVERLLNDDNLESIDGILANLERTSRRLTPLVDDAGAMLRSIGPVVESTEAAIEQLRAVAATAEAAIEPAEVRSLVLAAHDALSKLGAVEQSVMSLSEQFRQVVDGNAAPLHDALFAFREALTEIHGLARRLRAAPSSLIFGADPTEISLPATAPGGGR